MKKKIIQTDKAPAPIGPYNQAVAVGNLLFVSGQIPLDPATGQLVMDNIEAEAEQVMKNLQGVLEAAGTDFSHVVKSTIFLTDMANFAQVNGVYGKYFDEESAPARETVQVAALPRGVHVEISVIAVLSLPVSLL
jgi:2-iminobutanoate/2-iminopropanoate deaminase